MSKSALIQLSRISRWLGITAIIVLCLRGSSAAAPALTFNQTVGPPTTQLNVAGTAFGLGQPVDVFFDTTDLFLAITDGTGAFSATLKVPAAAMPDTLDHGYPARQPPPGGGTKVFPVRSDWAQFRNGPLHKGVSPFENVQSGQRLVAR